MADTKAQIVISARDDTGAALAKARAGFANLQQQAGGVANALIGVNAAITGVLAGTGLAALFSNTVRGLDALNDLKDATGASIENISALEDVAARTGTSFETIAQTLTKFNAALKEAKPGSDIAAVLNSIGLEVDNLRQLDPAEALRQTAVAFAGFADDGNKARAAQELFGKSLKDVAPFLKDLGDKLMLVGTTTTEQAAEAQKFNDQLANLSKNASDAARRLTGELLPSINGLFDRANRSGGFLSLFEDNLKIQLDEFALQRASDEIERLTAEAAALKSQLDFSDTRGLTRNRDTVARYEEIRGELVKLQAEAQRAGDSLRGLVNKQSPLDLAGALKGAGDFSMPSIKVPEKKVAAALSEAQKYLDKLNEAQIAALDLSAEEQARYDIAIGKLGRLTAEQEKQILLAAKALDLLKQTSEVGPEIPLEELQRRNDAQKEVERLLGQTTQGQINELTKQYGYLSEALSNGTITSRQYVDALDLLDERFGDLGKSAAEVQEQISEFSKQAARNIQDAVGDTVLASLEGRFDSIADLWANLIKKLVAEALAAKLNEALFGNLLGGPGQGTGLIGEIFGGFFANGGYLEPGKIGVVGERGPELIMAGASGTTVTPIAAAGPSVSVTYSIGQIGSSVSRAEVIAGMNAVREQTRGELMQVLRKRGVA